MNEPSSPSIRHNFKVRLFEPPTAQGRGPFKILLTKLDHIGDFFTAIEAFRIMRHSFAGAEITLICLPSVVALAQSTGLFDKVKGFSAIADSNNLGKIPQMDETDQIANFTDLLDGRYFLAADFKQDSDTRKWLDHVDAECRAGFAVQTRKGLDILIPPMEWDVATGLLAEKNLPIHAETRLTLLAHAIAESLLEKTLDADLFHTPEDLSDVTSFRAIESQTRMKIGISVGAGSELRKWKNDYWAQLLPRLAKTHNAYFVFFGGKNDKEETQALAAMLEPDGFMDLTGEVPLEYVPAYINAMDVYIGCDTGLTHLAANLGIATVNIFAGISNVSVWRAKGAKVKTIYTELACGPCHKRLHSECPNNNICMGAIVPDIVYAVFEQLVTN